VNPEIHDLVGAYATDGLSDDERTAFAEHLATCEECAGELASYREVLGALAGAHPTLPPPALEDLVVAAAMGRRAVPGAAEMAGSGAPRPGPPAGPAGGPESRGNGTAETGSEAVGTSPGRSAAGSATPDPGGADEGAAPTTAPGSGVAVVELASRRRRSTWLGMTAAAVAGLALFAGGVVVGRQSTPPAEVASGGDMDSLLAVASANDATYLPVDLLGTQTRVVVSDEMGKVAVLASDLPTPAKGMCYQVWRVTEDGSKESAGTFTPDADGHVAVVLEGGADATSFVITMEPPGGSKAPTGEMVGQVDA
jgi:hypothetical protein